MKYTEKDARSLVGRKFTHNNHTYILESLDKGEFRCRESTMSTSFQLAADSSFFRIINDDVWKFIDEVPLINNSYEIY